MRDLGKWHVREYLDRHSRLSLRCDKAEEPNPRWCIARLGYLGIWHEIMRGDVIAGWMAG